MNPTKDTTVGTVDLTAAGEARFLKAALRRGAVIVSATAPETDTAEAVAAALAVVERTLDALEHVLEADGLPDIIVDRPPRYDRAG